MSTAVLSASAATIPNNLNELAPLVHPGRKPPVLPGQDIGHLAKWSVSSFKFGFGPECLQDDDPDTFWQYVPVSDGPQPHFVTIEFPRKMAIQVKLPLLSNSPCTIPSSFLSMYPDIGFMLQKISLFLSFPLDDSYTPAAISIRAGTGLGDLQEVRSITLEKPDGWITFDVSTEPGDDGDGFKPVHAYILQILILTNHMNGKDTHVRGMRILGPVE
ncbi:hypothetical protein EW146_g8599 [Bondarzewia mesenterica]|uniref:Anaphase-promoting complex subunit 10 n=1 Tax=Bondarzewia mesenterica TaxID=1095465 RepID=A0A4S4LD53_9AGAM|nr:hypothetical protein EW146_g8599 [Bondarzewia mesenterica]